MKPQRNPDLSHIVLACVILRSSLIISLTFRLLTTLSCMSANIDVDGFRRCLYVIMQHCCDLGEYVVNTDTRYVFLICVVVNIHVISAFTCRINTAPLYTR